MVEHLTLEEQEKVLLVAESLIKNEENWIKGKWRVLTKRKNANGERMCKFCIHGAVNHAVVEVVGLERAQKLGAAHEKDNYHGFSVSSLTGGVRELGLDAISRELHGRYAMFYNDDEDSTHEGVLEILRTKLKRVRRSMNPGKEKK